MSTATALRNISKNIGRLQARWFAGTATARDKRELERLVTLRSAVKAAA